MDLNHHSPTHEAGGLPDCPILLRLEMVGVEPTFDDGKYLGNPFAEPSALHLHKNKKIKFRLYNTKILTS